MKVVFILVICLSLAGVGCMYKMNTAVFPIITTSQDLTGVRAAIIDYRLHPEKVTETTRNNLIERIVGIADEHFVSSRNRFTTGRSAFDFAGEATSTTLSAVGALVGGSSALSAATALATATQISIDKNFFSNVATQTIVTEMEAQRAAWMTTILVGENESVSSYGLEAALNDVRQYDDAGTVQTALVSLAVTTSAERTRNETVLRAQRALHK